MHKHMLGKFLIKVQKQFNSEIMASSRNDARGSGHPQDQNEPQLKPHALHKS